MASGDVDELTRVGSEVFSPHRLRYRGKQALLSAVEFDRLSLITMRYRGESTVETTQELGYFAVHLPLVGRASVRFGSEQVDTSPESGAVFNPADRPAMRWSADLYQYGVKIPVGVLSRQAAALAGSGADRPVVFRHAPVGVAPSAWGGAARMLVETVARAGASLSPGSRHALEEAFLTTLLFTQPSNWSDRLLSDATSASRSAVELVVDFIEADPAADWSVAALAKASSSSARSLQVAFRDALGTTPMTYVRDARLRLAHDLLTDPDMHAVSVAEIASRSGFGHLGRFAAAYREAFGVLPSAGRG